MRTVSFVVPGIATPWARAGRKGGFSFTPGKQRAAMADIKVLAQRAMEGAPLLAGPVMVRVTVTYPWPASLSARKRALPNAHWKGTRPDLSNLVKLIEDALIGVVYTDDGQIAGLAAYKTYDERAEIAVTISDLAGDASIAEAA